MKVDKQMQSLAARFSHELAGPLGAVGQAGEMTLHKISTLLSPAEQKILQAGLEANLTPTGRRQAVQPSSRLPAVLACKVEMAQQRNPRLAPLLRGMGRAKLERALKIFDIGFAAKCSRAGLETSLQIIQNLRTLGDFSRSDLLKKVSVADTLQTAWMLIHLSEKDLRIHWKISKVPSLTANAAALTQVWLNLFANACQINNGHSTLYVNLFEKNKKIIIEIANDGVPLPRGVDVFAEGFTRRVGGRGLGLHLCRQIIEAHRGRISAAPGANGSGAVFSITLPAK